MIWTHKKFLNPTTQIIDYLGVMLYLVHRYVLSELTDHCPGSSLSNINLLHVNTVCVGKWHNCDYASNTQVQTRHVNPDFFICPLRLCFLPA